MMTYSIASIAMRMRTRVRDEECAVSEYIIRSRKTLGKNTTSVTETQN